MTTRRGTRAATLVLALALATPALPALAGWKQIPVDVAVPARIETEPGQRTLVALFRGSGHERLDVGLEITQWMRREIARQTALAVLETDPPPIPEQRPEALVMNDPFWRRLGEDFKADLIVAGIAEYLVDDRSGFVTEDVISPVTGQTVRRSRFAERRGFALRVRVFFFKGDNGALLHSDVWNESRILEGGAAEDLQQLYELLDAMRVHLRATVLPTKVQQPRFIWVE